MSSLYDLSEEYLLALNTLTACDEIDEQTIKDTLEGLEGSIRDKAIQVAAYILNMEAQCDSLENTIKQLMERHERKSYKASKLKHYLMMQLEKCNLHQIEDDRFDIKIKKNPPKVEIYNDEIVPSNFITETVCIGINKKAINEALRNGIEVPGAKLTNSKRLSISI